MINCSLYNGISQCNIDDGDDNENEDNEDNEDDDDDEDGPPSPTRRRMTVSQRVDFIAH